MKFSISQNAAPTQLAVKIIEAAYSKLGIKVEKQRVSRSRASVMASKGEIDGELAGPKLFEKKFPSLKRIDVPIMTIDVVIFACDQRPDDIVRKDLADKRVGRIDGAELISKYTKPYKNVWLGENFKQLFKMLQLNRLDAVIGPRIALNTFTRENDPGCIRVVGHPLDSIPLFHFIHEKHATLIPRLTDVLREMLNSGEIDRIKKSLLTH
ncbi:MAG: transporter substrate-binding domain-containing protein [Roseibium sp.]